MFHITIGVSSQTPPSMDVDLRMVKAAILYADKAKLCSSNYSTWMPVLLRKNITIKEQLKQLDGIEEAIPYMFHTQREIDQALSSIRRAKKSLQTKNPSIKDLQYRISAKKLAAQQYEDFEKKFKLNLEEANKTLDRAVQAGLLEIHSFKILESENLAASDFKGTFNKSVEKMADEFVGLVMNTVSDASTYPLFDDGAGSLVQIAVKYDLIAPTQTRVAQGKQTHLAANILSRLPLFDKASMDEILDIRRELETHLIRFRSAIMKYSDKIRNASWDEEFSAEAEETFHRDIEPAVLDIEDAVRSNKSLLELSLRKLVDKPAAGTSILSFIVSQLSALPTITTMVLAAGVGTATAIYDAHIEAQRQQQTVEQNQLYFYYRAGELLADRGFA